MESTKEVVSQDPRYPILNQEFLDFLALEETMQYLRSILDGSVSSERRDIVREMFAQGNWNFGIWTSIFSLNNANLDLMFNALMYYVPTVYARVSSYRQNPLP